jgi:hypothetical protein
MPGTWKDKRYEALRAKLPNGEVQCLLVELDPVTKVVKILSHVHTIKKRESLAWAHSQA